MLLVVSLVVCASAIPRLTFDGNVLNVLAGKSEAFRSYRHVQNEFRDFSGDLAIIVRADDLYEPEGIEKLRILHLDLTLVDGVESVFSLFTASRIDPATGAIASMLPERFEDGDDVRDIIAKAGEKDLLIAQFSRPERNAALISIESPFSEENGQAPDAEPVYQLIDEIRAIAPEGLQLDFVGYPLLRADAVEALISDQTLLTILGVSLVFLVSLATFRAVIPATVCALPALASVVWVLGGYGIAGSSINYLSTALPTIAMVLALADTIMLYFTWSAIRGRGVDGREAIAAAIRRVGPANSMTSITTAVAFGSFAFGGNQALRSLAILGSSAVMIAFAAVMIILPLLLYFFGHRIKVGKRQGVFEPLGTLVSRFAMWRPAAIATAAGLAAVALTTGHINVDEQHEITDQLPRDSQAALGEKLAVDIFGGVAPIYLILPVPEGSGWAEPKALDALAEAETAFGGEIGQQRVISLARLREAGLSQQAITDAMDEASDTLRGRFLSDDREEYLVTGTVPYGMNPDTAVAAAEEVVDDLGAHGIEGAKVTGYPILAAIEIPNIVNDLRNSLIIAIVLGVLVLAIGSRAPIVAAAALLPNLIPVLFIETSLWVIGTPMDIPHVIALTIAFGISIDNAVHVINAFLANQSAGMKDREAMHEALLEVAPALVSATFMFIAGSFGTLFSSLPSVSNLGFLIISTLCVALVANLAFLPALILTLRRIMGRAA
ncbi:MAG: MMPL family transporter [Rhizobiaceae bacterium]|nr:MMPL family transporter [Rhizobiaceae bacterium]